jgi:hypothetical protein
VHGSKASIEKDVVIVKEERLGHKRSNWGNALGSFMLIWIFVRRAQAGLKVSACFMSKNTPITVRLRRVHDGCERSCRVLDDSKIYRLIPGSESESNDMVSSSSARKSDIIALGWREL